MLCGFSLAFSGRDSSSANDGPVSPAELDGPSIFGIPNEDDPTGYAARSSPNWIMD